MTDAERDEMYARLLVAEVERDAALTQLHEQTEEILHLRRRLDAMREALD